jgi:beta-glucosidase
MIERRSLRILIVVCLAALVASALMAQGTEVGPEDLTLAEKAALVTGANTWQTAGVPRLGVPQVWMTDGPAGLRKSTSPVFGENEPATCFPSASALAATWNPELVERVGAAIGEEARRAEVKLLLAPGLNMKRHPLAGRNFEYMSEDPLLSGKLAAAFVRGVQSRGVGATLKHYAVNNQETRRMTIDARLDERTLREIYLRGFEIALAEGRPWAVMSAYNRVNGTYASEHRHLLTEILRGEWGFDGLVVSDWGAVDDPVASLAAGLDLEMPGNPLTPAGVVAAVESGALAEADLDRAVAHVLALGRPVEVAPYEPVSGPASGSEEDVVAPHHELARAAAAESIVLLENDGLLPIASTPARRLGVVGRLAVEPRIQGIGSSQVTPLRVDEPWAAVKRLGEAAGHDLALFRAAGEDGLEPEERSALETFVVSRDALVVFAGQKASHDAEAWDRPSMALAPTDLETLELVLAADKPVVVVLVGGGAIDVRPVAGMAGAVVMGWLGGQGFGEAIARVLFGHASPSGKLSETFALAVEDHPSDLDFPGAPHAVRYGERLFVGYRYFQSTGHAVAYPFGHGLSYTRFELRDVTAPESLERPEPLLVSLEVANTGERRGAETVQVYLRRLDSELPCPDRELVAFRKVALEAGETRRAELAVEPERLAYFDDRHDAWVVAPGEYELLVGVSAADIRAVLPFALREGTVPPLRLTLESTLGDLYGDPQGRVVVDFIFRAMGRPPLAQAAADDFLAAILRDMPFEKLAPFSGGALTPAIQQQLLMMVNGDMDPEQLRALLERQMSAAQPVP